jgi:hypothetical protein
VDRNRRDRGWLKLVPDQVVGRHASADVLLSGRSLSVAEAPHWGGIRGRGWGEWRNPKVANGGTGVFLLRRRFGMDSQRGPGYVADHETSRKHHACGKIHCG